MSRDYAAEMRALIDAETKGAYESRVVAAHIVEKLRATDQELLTGWLDAQAESLLWQAINDRDRSSRAATRSASSRSVFARDAKAHEDGGETTVLARWLSTPFTLPTNVRKPLGDMTKEDLLATSGTYEEKARSNRMTAAFLAALAKRTPRGKTVRDVFDDDKIDRMWQSITSAAAA